MSWSPELRPASLATLTVAGASVSGHAQIGTIEAVRSALIHIPNTDLDYDSWVRIGMAIKGSLGEAGKEVFSDWSDQASKNDPAITEKAWGSFRPERIGAGTIYHLAMERGWKPDPGMVLDGSQPIDECHPASGLLARLDVTADAEAVTAPASFNLTIPGGLVGKLTDYMLSTARRPQPLLSLGASLCAIGALMGRLYRTESNLRSNLYVVGIADSGSGKNHSREIINEVLFEAGLANHLGGNKIASGAGLLTALHRQPAILFQIDEFGMFLSAAADRKRSPRHITEILDAHDRALHLGWGSSWARNTPIAMARTSGATSSSPACAFTARRPAAFLGRAARGQRGGRIACPLPDPAQ
ncbi:MAG: PriCT-2 domain-containing protein [Sphingomonadales bacterium]|nr:PriCT-2 domain-containing protein [Sphingomonadales bacterium]